MKKLDTSFGASGFPIKSGTLDFLQFAYQEGFDAVIKNIIGSTYSTTTMYALFGCVVTGMHGTGTTGVTSITSGAVFYNGEFFLVDAQSFNWGAGFGTGFDTSIVVTQYTTNADTVTYNDASTHNVHNIRKIKFQGLASPTPPPLGLTSSFASPIVPVSIPLNPAYKLQETLQTGGSFPLTITFVQDTLIAIASAVGVSTITLDFTNAVQGTKVKVYTFVNSGASFSLSYAGGSIVSLVSGSLSPSSGTYILEFTYRGQPVGGGNNVVSVTVTNQP